jgi:hypothetical protein
MATNAVDLIASPTLLLFYLNASGLNLFQATIGESLLNTKSQIEDSRFEMSDLTHLVEQTFSELTKHTLNVIVRFVHTLLGVGSPGRVLEAGASAGGAVRGGGAPWLKIEATR